MSTGLAPRESLMQRSPRVNLGEHVATAWDGRSSYLAHSVADLWYVARVGGDLLHHLEREALNETMRGVLESGRLAIALEVRWYVADRDAAWYAREHGAGKTSGCRPLWRDEVLTAAAWNPDAAWYTPTSADVVVCEAEAVTLAMPPAWGGA